MIVSFYFKIYVIWKLICAFTPGHHRQIIEPMLIILYKKVYIDLGQAFILFEILI